MDRSASVSHQPNGVLPPPSLKRNLSTQKHKKSEKDAPDCDDSDDEPSKSQLMSGLANAIIKRKLPSKQATLIDIASESSDDDDVLIISDINGNKSRMVSKNISSESSVKAGSSKAKVALDAFLKRCRPNYSPVESQDVNRNVKERPKKQKAPSNHDKSEVSFELLDSLPGNNNRFKRIRRTSDEADLWRVDLEDLPGNSSKKKQRYFRMKRCDICKEFTDHCTSQCPKPPPQPVCIICGIDGHTAGMCDRRFCTKCCGQGHSANACQRTLKNELCHSCNLHGHREQTCPNNWRRYHLTVDQVEPEPQLKSNVKVNDRIFCCNCGHEGHFAFECRTYIVSKIWATSPLFYATSRMANKIATAKPIKIKGNSKRKIETNGLDTAGSNTPNGPSKAKRAKKSRLQRQLLNGAGPSSDWRWKKDTSLLHHIDESKSPVVKKKKKNKKNRKNSLSKSRLKEPLLALTKSVKAAA